MHRFRTLALRALTAIALMAATSAIAVGSSSAPAAADPYVVTLTASDTTPGPNGNVTIRATVSPSVSSSGYWIQIYENGTRISYTSVGTSQSVVVSHPFGAYRYTAYVGSLSSTEPPSNVQGASNPVTVFWGAGSTTGADPGDPSHDCDAGSRVIDTFVGGAYVKVYTLNNATETSVCFRVDAVTQGVGGKVGLAHGDPVVDIGTVGIPFVDDQSRACASAFPNSLGLITDGYIASTYLYGYGYANTSNGVWLCLEVNNVKQRIGIPIELPGVDVQPNVTPILELD